MDAGELLSGHLGIKDENTARSSNKKLFRLLKISILACCLTGFGLQTAEFLDNFYKYPVVVSLEYQRMKEFPIPAFTFCSKYWYDFKQYCQEFPDNCETTEYPKNFCDSYPWSCERNATHGIMPTTFPDFYFDKNILKRIAYTSSMASLAGN
ncbi:hypothetical protein JTE90_012987 [Oedothorax gibbosus]|uniref:Uncharacterized protein n=1 Tax=Oedothorax gibbosus TaxID=931172 RepID=A0AAV6TNY6_9ARAC|nr:hypothetical protein JTE90_012987 [Oedothorax gibbosus]